MFSVVTSRPSYPESAAPADPGMDLHPVVLAAASGRLPDWAAAGPERGEHIARVAALLDSWAEASGLPDEERARWRAAGYLHDALRDAEPSSLREWVEEDADLIPDALLHGPAAAARLRAEGVTDDELLAAVAYHTIGDASLGRLGRALYAADFLEPGRTFVGEDEAELRKRAPSELDAVVTEVARRRISNVVDRGLALHPRTVAFWNRLVAEGHG